MRYATLRHALRHASSCATPHATREMWAEHVIKWYPDCIRMFRDINPDDEPPLSYDGKGESCLKPPNLVES